MSLISETHYISRAHLSSESTSRLVLRCLVTLSLGLSQIDRCRILLTGERMNCYCCLSIMNEKFSLLYRKSSSFIYLLILHLLIHRDSSENRDLRLSRRFFLLIKLSSFFVVISIWSHQNCIFIFELIDLSTISKINKSERNHLDWMIVERLDAKLTNWWRIDDTNRFK
jgi:hypothetical protein